eukprot:741262-Rhodomonas_salina.1
MYYQAWSYLTLDSAAVGNVVLIKVLLSDSIVPGAVVPLSAVLVSDIACYQAWSDQYRITCDRDCSTDIGYRTLPGMADGAIWLRDKVGAQIEDKCKQTEGRDHEQEGRDLSERDVTPGRDRPHGLDHSTPQT